VCGGRGWFARAQKFYQSFGAAPEQEPPASGCRGRGIPASLAEAGTGLQQGLCGSGGAELLAASLTGREPSAPPAAGRSTAETRVISNPAARSLNPNVTQQPKEVGEYRLGEKQTPCKHFSARAAPVRRVLWRYLSDTSLLGSFLITFLLLGEEGPGETFSLLCGVRGRMPAPSEQPGAALWTVSGAESGPAPAPTPPRGMSRQINIPNKYPTVSKSPGGAQKTARSRPLGIRSPKNEEAGCQCRWGTLLPPTAGEGPAALRAVGSERSFDNGAVTLPSRLTGGFSASLWSTTPPHRARFALAAAKRPPPQSLSQPNTGRPPAPVSARRKGLFEHIMGSQQKAFQGNGLWRTAPHELRFQGC